MTDSGDAGTRATDATERLANTPSKPAPTKKKPSSKKTAPKMTVVKKTTDKLPVADNGSGGKSGWPGKRTFPSVTIEDALKLPQAIKLKNGGNPWTTALAAVACGLTTHKSEKFFYLASASQNYGLTVGSRTSPTIALTDLGRVLVYAPSPDVEHQKKVEAFFNVEKFKQVYDYYNGSHLPEKQYLSNALESQFELPPDQHDEFTEVFQANCKYLGFENGLGKVATKSGTGDGKTADMRSMGKPKGDFKYTAFVAMPFSEKGKQERAKGFFDEVIKSVITPAANSAGFAVVTARRDDSDIIHHTIIKELLNADLLIADLTDHNPNVLFELGIRLAERKPVVIIKSKDTGTIFDVDNLLRVYMYDQNLWSTTVQGDVKALTDRIAGTWDNRETAVGYMDILTTGKSEGA